MIKFFKNCKKTPFWSHFGNFGAKQNFTENSILTGVFFIVTKNYFVNFQKKLMCRFLTALVSDGQRGAQTDKHEFIGPFWLKLQVQKGKYI